MTKSDDDVTLPMQKLPVSHGKRLGRYELLERLGKGGMGIVYRAMDTKLDRPVAVKLLLTDLEGDSETRERFLREARAAGELSHRNIIKVYDFGEDGGRAFLVMELLEGVSLNEFLKEHPDLSLDRKLQIMTGVCNGLAFSHSRSIVHRDLKPANLFITKDRQVKVLDFGLARISSSNLTRSGLVFGTPDYMSPEQVRGKVVDARSDIFSLGAVFYQVLSGRKPFAAKALPEVMRKVLTDEPAPLTHAEAPPSLARIVMRSLEKDPLKRYQKVEELLAELGGVDPDEPAERDAAADVPRQIDRYQILERVGEGGMGVVYRARDPVLDRDVAIKSMQVDFGVDEDARARFQQEARAAARLQHPNIVTIYEFGEKDDSPYLIMEFLGGDDLEGLMKSDQALSLIGKLDIVTQLCDGLAFAHEQGVVHRDIKPGNVRVLDDGTVKLLDFGIAKVQNAGATAGSFAGSAGYASPEQLSLEPVDARSDLFSVGVLTYELLTGRQPFTGESGAAIAYQVLNEEPPPLRSISPQLPEVLEAVVTRVLQKKPDQRYGTASELAEALRAVSRQITQPNAAADGLARRGRRGPRTDRAGNLNLRVGSNKGGKEPPVDVSIGRAGPPLADAVKPRNRLVTVAVGVALVALSAFGGIYALRMLGGDEAPAPVEETRAAAEAGADGAPAVEPEADGPATDPEPGDLDVPVVPPVQLMLEVTSSPPGAAVSLDGQDTGEVTPVSFPLADPYPETIALSMDGYEGASQPVPPVEGESVAVAFDLTREETFGRVVLSGPYRFEVWSGDRRIREAASEHDVTLPTGAASLRIRNPGYFLDRQFNVEVVEGQSERLIAPALGSLTVFSNPGNCEIFVDSRSIDYPPITRREVAPGTYTVSRGCADERENRQQQVTVVSNQDERVTLAPVER
ncbi:MAG: serine/threonine-protein kinase [Vicinamibacterales bacterium]|jgi:serine/threonine-protein kinase|nr:serine/threonine-protein kinase [Vicinamibacterales bacterium]